MPDFVLANLEGEVKYLEMPGIEPGAFRTRSGRSTTEPHPRRMDYSRKSVDLT